jgi:4-diphosphocytidyl-2-C-methyl-D-erythritol kinase
MIVFPVAKINLGLRITEKRTDGYHNIETVFYPVPFCDALEFIVPEEQNDRDLLFTSGIETGASIDNNLVIKAVKKLRESHYIPFLKFHLHKAIPTGAGLGGGSSDAACLLKSLNRFFSLKINDDELKNIALTIGSDCPFFIDGTPAIGTGRGEILKPAADALTGYYMVLLNPRLHVSTREAYESCKPQKPSDSLDELIKMPVVEWRYHIFNDFEEYAFSKFPLISDLKNELYEAGALFSLMSGSGSSVFGIFSEKPQLPEKIREYVIWEGSL